MSNDYTQNDTRDYAFEFEARIIQASSVSWERTKDKDGQPLSSPRCFHVHKYSFTSDKINGVLIEWLDNPSECVIKSGPCKIRFRQLRPSKQMFGFYELSGYPVLVK